MMSNAAKKIGKVSLTSIVFLILISFATGEDSIKFRLENVNCTDELVHIQMNCNVPNPYKGIKILKDGKPYAFCVKNHGQPIPYCDTTPPHSKPSVSRLINSTLIYTLETIKEDFIVGQWVCRNGGKKDLNSSIFVPRINCETKSKSFNDVPRSESSDEKKTSALISLFLILVLLAACFTQLYLRLCNQTEENKNKQKKENESTCLSKIPERMRFTCITETGIEEDKNKQLKENKCDCLLKKLECIHCPCIKETSREEDKKSDCLLKLECIHCPCIKGTSREKNKETQKKDINSDCLLTKPECMRSTCMRERRRALPIVFHLISLLVYFGFSITIYTIEVKKDARIALTVVCCLLGIVFFVVIPMKWTSNQRQRDVHDHEKGNQTAKRPEIEGNAEIEQPDTTSLIAAQVLVRETPEGGNQTIRPSEKEDNTEGIISTITSQITAQVHVHEPPEGRNQTTGQSETECNAEEDKSDKNNQIQVPNERDRLMSEREAE